MVAIVGRCAGSGRWHLGDLLPFSFLLGRGLMVVLERHVRGVGRCASRVEDVVWCLRTRRVVLVGMMMLVLSIKSRVSVWRRLGIGHCEGEVGQGLSKGYILRQEAGTKSMAACAMLPQGFYG